MNNLRGSFPFINVNIWNVCFSHNDHIRDVDHVCLYILVKDMGQQMGYRSLEWNSPKEAMNRPIWAGIIDGAKLF